MQKVIYGIGALFALLLIVGFALPRTHQIEVSAEVDAHPATVFALVNDFRRFTLWSPWADTDPSARFRYSGATRGEGAVMTWDGAIIGTGSHAITESRPHEYVGIAMNPGEPGEARSWFRLSPGVGTTIVSWGFEADYGMNIVGRYFASMLGGVVARDYDNGLAALKQLAESLPGTDFGDLDIEHRIVEAVDIAYLPITSSTEHDAVAAAMGKAYFRLLSFIDENDLYEAGAPLSILREFGGARLAIEAAIPIRELNENTRRGGAGVKIGQTYAGPVIRIRHIGSYRTLAVTHRRISAYLAALGIERADAPWESYISDPGDVPENELQTDVYYPVVEN